jgi:hypothetical protein
MPACASRDPRRHPAPTAGVCLLVMRPRLSLLIAPFLLLLIVAASALGVRIQTGPSHTLLYKAADADGAVKFYFNYMDTTHSGGPVTDKMTLVPFRFANGCAAHVSKVPGTIKVASDKRFDYQAHGFTVEGRLIGNSYQPRKIVGTARVVTAGCDSGALAFTAKPQT